MTTVFDEISALSAATENTVIAEARKQGKKIIGYFCSYVPEEIITAAGMVPYRMRAVEPHGTSRADAYYSSMNCTFSRSCFDKVLNGDFEFLDGVIFMNNCDHTRRMHDNWRYSGKGPKFIHMLYVPHVITSDGEGKYREGLEELVREVEKHFNVAIPGSALTGAIELHNKKRSLLRRINETRKSPELPVKASEMLRLMLAVTAMPVEQANSLLERFLNALDGRNVGEPGDMRMMLAGGCVEEPEHLEMMESLGAAIVADYICLGSRYADRDVSSRGDPFFSIAERYYRHLSCPRMMNDTGRRFDYVLDTMNDYQARALIAEKLKFCMLFFGETFLYKEESKKHSYPLLVLEREYGDRTEGQQKTRIQAFIEQLRNFD